jgi:hypothetical protein
VDKQEEKAILAKGQNRQKFEGIGALALSFSGCIRLAQALETFF